MTSQSCPFRGTVSDAEQNRQNAGIRSAGRRGPPRFVVFGLGIGLGVLLARKLTTVGATN